MVLLMVMAQPIYALTELRIFTLKHHFAKDLYEVITPLVGQGGTVTGTHNQLIVRATPSQLSEIEAVIATIDVPRINRRITVANNRNLLSNHNNTELSGNINIGNVTIGNRPGRTGSRIDITRQQQESTQTSQQFIQVVDGERAFIQVGKLVPFTQDWVVMTRRFTQITSTTDWVEVSTGFAVKPRTIGNQVEIEITPRITKLNGHQSIDFESLSTVIRVGLGEWVNIGQTMMQRDDVSRKILGLQTGAVGDKSNLSIRVD